jgi:hypothetical protein
MPSTPLTVTPITRAGIAPTLAAANVDGHTIPSNTGRIFLHINNASGAPVTVSAAIPKSVDGVAVPAKTLSVPAGAARLFGPFPRDDYNDATGAVAISFSAVTDVTVGAFAV